MKMDYSKAFELLNQDIEKENRNKMAEKAVHNNLYNKGFRDGTAILDKISAEMLEEMLSHSGTGEEVIQAYVDGLKKGLEIINKYRK
jgi:hypothetical protein